LRGEHLGLERLEHSAAKPCVGRCARCRAGMAVWVASGCAGSLAILRVLRRLPDPDPVFSGGSVTAQMRKWIKPLSLN
jgi:hypothetical protein